MTKHVFAVVTVTMEDRPDGGLRVYSDDLPGLILSGPVKEVVVKQTTTAIKALFEHNGARSRIGTPDAVPLP